MGRRELAAALVILAAALLGARQRTKAEETLRLGMHMDWKRGARTRLTLEIAENVIVNVDHVQSTGMTHVSL